MRALFLAAMSLIVVIACFSYVLDLPDRAQDNSADTSLSLRAFVSRSEYLIGEPIRIIVVLKNTGEARYRLRKASPPGAIKVMYSADGKDFRRYESGVDDWERTLPSFRDFAPREEWQSDVILCYTNKTPCRLVFPKSGKHFVKIKYSLEGPSFQGGQTIESNILALTITDPTGKDVEVFQELNNDSVLFFLQTGYAKVSNGIDDPGDRIMVSKLLDIFTKHPNTSYRASLWDVLCEFYFKNKERIQPADQRKICDVLCIADVTEKGADQRLNQKVEGLDVIRSRQEISVEELLSVLSRPAKVPLVTKLEKWTIRKPFPIIIDEKPVQLDNLGPDSDELRSWMEWLRDEVCGAWKVENGGYRLLQNERCSKGTSMRQEK